ncbi:hypothetical protein [Pseudomonas sp. zfem005]|uniref:hypothetical protein n=1 Tax=Pseudomonas sp. zfem005 TaxID=3078200 RepID=UPI00292A020A|nr:hypothetical protein [Pseudomonas sp. zfem005]MDU9416104.1 hypothetical protein [Pseudomonas sp. zfem005]
MNPAAPEPTSLPSPSKTHEFLRDVETALASQALPLFEEAARHARRGGIEVTVEMDSSDPLHPQLRLAASNPGTRTSHYRIIADAANLSLVHEEFYAFNDETRTLPAQLASINETVIDTRLAAFFLKAFALPLDYVTERRKAGFW